ncbi:MAG: hypothetical protein HY701_12395 [Gemmatimonadetes bacterium]|nr:hypothetical protein [Gemmatimonadota bacterium]
MSHKGLKSLVAVGKQGGPGGRPTRSGRWTDLAVWGLSLLPVMSVILAACASTRELPPARPIIVRSGVRIVADSQRLNRIDEWLRRQLENIEEDPSFLITVTPRDTAPPPWRGLAIAGDSAEILAPREVPDAGTVLMVYAHLHLMDRMGKIPEWLPEAADLPRGYPLERVIMRRLAEAWLYARAVADAGPWSILDELMYANEFGYLDAYLLTARAGQFPDDRRRWLEENPGREDEFRTWFQRTFGEDPPGWAERPGR